MCLKAGINESNKGITESMDDNRIVMGTSLAPFNFEKQMKAVQSWIENGFYVISCNTKEEIHVLKDVFANISVEFVEVERTAENICEKKMPYIQDILNIASSRAEKVCGFINSDIMLSHMINGMYEFILEEAKDSLIFGRRNEINQYADIENLNWDVNFDGIDLFFMDTYLVKDFFDDDFYVQSGWDLCILIKCKLLGIRIKELVNPVAFHLKHKIQWNFKETGMLVKKFMEKYFGTSENSYRYASDLYYEILYNGCQQICFCTTQKYQCLFILDQKNSKTVNSINAQDYLNKEVRYSDVDKDFFDIVFYIHGELVLNNIFCKTVIYIMEQFNCGILNIGRFFISERNGSAYYNCLSRNLKIVKQLNEQNNMFTKVIFGKRKKSGTLYLPISHEAINDSDRQIKDIHTLPTKAYIMPAGVRANEWYDTNKDNFGWKILGYIDNDRSKIGSEINGQKVYPVEVLKNDRDDVFVIVVSKYYSVEIEEQLSNIIDKDKILNANYIFDINSDAAIDYFSFDKYRENRKGKSNDY